MFVRAAVAYCGGCNPEIDRAGLIESLIKKTGLTVSPAGRAGPEVELLIVVNGCARRCLRKNTALKYKELIVVAGLSIDGWPVAREEMDDILSRRVKEVDGLEKRLRKTVDRRRRGGEGNPSGGQGGGGPRLR